MAAPEEPLFDPVEIVNESMLSGRELAEFLSGMTALDGTNYLDIYREAMQGEGDGA